MPKKIGTTYLYVVTIFSIIILVYSIWILFTTIQTWETGKAENTYFGLFAAGLGIILALSSLMRIRNRVALIEKSKSKISTVVKCKKCDFKIIRDFTTGDYVHKELDSCQQCSDRLVITSIYMEKPKKSKQ
ncbi:hypothetical protein [[Eubacterium] cellulosolvens]